MMATIALDAGKTLVKVAADQIPVNGVYYIKPSISRLLLILVYPYAFKFFKMTISWNLNLPVLINFLLYG